MKRNDVKNIAFSLVAVFCSFLLPHYSQASVDICASGWGTTVSNAGAMYGKDINGTWVNSGTYSGKPYYLLAGTAGYLSWDSGGYWIISDASVGSSGFTGNITDYGASSVATPDLMTGWTAYNISHSGTFASGACGGGSGTTTPPVLPPSVPEYFSATTTCTQSAVSIPRTASTTFDTVATTTCVSLVPLLGSTATSSLYVYTGVSYRDWLYVSIVLIFLLAFVPLGFFASALKRRSKYHD